MSSPAGASSASPAIRDDASCVVGSSTPRSSCSPTPSPGMDATPPRTSTVASGGDEESSAPATTPAMRAICASSRCRSSATSVSMTQAWAASRGASSPACRAASRSASSMSRCRWTTSGNTSDSRECTTPDAGNASSSSASAPDRVSEGSGIHSSRFTASAMSARLPSNRCAWRSNCNARDGLPACRHSSAAFCRHSTARATSPCVSADCAARISSRGFSAIRGEPNRLGAPARGPRTRAPASGASRPGSRATTPLTSGAWTCHGAHLTPWPGTAGPASPGT